MVAPICPICRQPHYFEAQACGECDSALCYMPDQDEFAALRVGGSGWVDARGNNRDLVQCANTPLGACNWAKAPGADEIYCRACRHNRILPNLSQPGVLVRWKKVELAKHRLFRSLIQLGVPLENRMQRPDGLAFDCLYDLQAEIRNPPEVLTGHDHGLITLNLMEADDSARERMREMMGERYRTLLGHFRHEVGHYFWQRLVWNTEWHVEFRDLFGDESADYDAALQRHYAQGPPSDWHEHFITSYAACHPWEDFAESFAHYLHMVDSLGTAGRFGMSITPFGKADEREEFSVDFNPYQAKTSALIRQWIPFSYALNAMNRSMGQPEFYPFDLSIAAVVKLDFVNRVVHNWHEAHSSSSFQGLIAMMRAFSQAPSR